MQVLILIKNLTSGGAEKQSILLGKALEQLHSVHYVIFNDRYKDPKYLTLLSENPSIKVVSFRGNLLSRFLQFCKYLHENQIEIVFSYLTAANFFAVLAAKLSGVKSVYTGIRNAYLPPVKAAIDRLLCNQFAEKAVLNCYSGKTYFAKNGFREEKLIVIPNCFENILPYRKKNEGNRPIRIITVGRFVEQKDYTTALRVIESIKRVNNNIIYEIVGFGELESSIRSSITQMHLDDIVNVYINPKNIPELLDNADIYLSTSLFEGTSNSIMEAMNADLPVVATNVGDNGELILDGQNGYLCKIKDVDAIAEKILFLLANTEVRERMGKKSKDHLIAEFSMDKFRESYIKLIEIK